MIVGPDRPSALGPKINPTDSFNKRGFMFIVPQPTPRHHEQRNDTPRQTARREQTGMPDKSPALPRVIPQGARIVVRRTAGIDPDTGRMTYRDVVGHVRHWDGKTLEMTRDAAANGSRPAQRVSIAADSIVRLKPVPERPNNGTRGITR